MLWEVEELTQPQLPLETLGNSHYSLARLPSKVWMHSSPHQSVCLCTGHTLCPRPALLLSPPHPTLSSSSMGPSAPADGTVGAHHPPLGESSPSGCCQLYQHIWDLPGLGPWLHLDVPSPLVGLVGHLLLHAGQLLLQVSHLVLVKLRQVVQLFLQPFVPGRGRRRDTSPGSRVPLLSPGSVPCVLNNEANSPACRPRPRCNTAAAKGTASIARLSGCCAEHSTQVISQDHPHKVSTSHPHFTDEKAEAQRG